MVFSFLYFENSQCHKYPINHVTLQEILGDNNYSTYNLNLFEENDLIQNLKDELKNLLNTILNTFVSMVTDVENLTSTTTALRLYIIFMNFFSPKLFF